MNPETTEKTFEITVNRGTGAEVIEVIDIEAASPEAAERKARNREDVTRVFSSCTVPFDRSEAGGRIY